jgi:hypothetical protein
MADTPTTDADAFQDLATIRDRVDYRGGDFFDDNAQLRFDELLVRLEAEARRIFVTLWGDETPLTEQGRTDTKRTTFDSAMLLAYPVNDVTKVEVKGSVGADWRTLDAKRYDFTPHRLVIATRNRNAPVSRGNDIAEHAERPTWRDLAEKVRVTYDRGFGAEPPGEIKSVQIQIINQLLRHLKREQTVAAASPEEFAGQTETAEVVTQEIRDRVDDVTKPGGATMSV